MEIELRQLVENLFVTLVKEEWNAGVLIAPNPVHDGKSDDHARGNHRIDLAEFAGVDSAADDSGEEILTTSDHLAGVELRKVWELVELAKDQAVNS